MKYFFTCLLFFFSFGSFLHAQTKEVQTQKLIIHPPFRSFFEKHSGLKEMRFYRAWATDSLELDMIEKDTNAIKAFNHFDLDDAGGYYFFQKRFGSFVFPSSLYTSWLDKKADYANVSGIIRNDSVFLTVTEFYHPKNDDEKIFIKIEAKWGYAKGLHKLAQELEARLSCFNVLVTDSIIVVKYLLEKKGALVNNGLEKGNLGNEYIKQVIQCLNTSGPWVAHETGGFKVRGYIKIYVKLNADKTYQVAMN